MLFDLRSSWKDISKLVEKGELSIAGINNIDEKVVVVLRKDKGAGIEVIDLTNQDIQISTGNEDATDTPDPLTNVVKVDSEGRVIDEDGSIFCRFCNNSYSSRGITRHENNCSKNPANQ